MMIVIKVLVEGDGGVGKTTLVKRYCDGTYFDGKMTIGVGFEKKTLKIGDDDITLMIWDFGGEERFREILPSFCKGANVALLVYDVSRRESFFNLREWVELTRKNAGDIPIILVGSKCDLEKRVAEDEVRKFIDECRILCHVETSAKTNVNVNTVFELAAKAVIKKSSLVEDIAA